MPIAYSKPDQILLSLPKPDPPWQRGGVSVHRARPKWSKWMGIWWIGSAPALTPFRAQGGLHEHRSGEIPLGPVLGGHMDTNRMFTNLLGGWLTAADKAAATTIKIGRAHV